MMSNNIINVALVGYGKMGTLFKQTIEQSHEFYLCGIVSKHHPDTLKSLHDLKVAPNIIIDFSNPEALVDTLEYALQNRIALIVGTTGYSDDFVNKLKEASLWIPVLLAPNTSFGVNFIAALLSHYSKQILENFDIEIIEKHHRLKKDAPSGTALLFKDHIIEANLPENNIEITHGRHGVSLRNNNEIGVHAIRGGTIVGEHTIILAGEDETIEITHKAQSKLLFVKGALIASKFMIKQKLGFFTMKDILQM